MYALDVIGMILKLGTLRAALPEARGEPDRRRDQRWRADTEGSQPLPRQRHGPAGQQAGRCREGADGRAGAAQEGAGQRGRAAAGEQPARGGLHLLARERDHAGGPHRLLGGDEGLALLRDLPRRGAQGDAGRHPARGARNTSPRRTAPSAGSCRQQGAAAPAWEGLRARPARGSSGQDTTPVRFPCRSRPRAPRQTPDHAGRAPERDRAPRAGEPWQPHGRAYGQPEGGRRLRSRPIGRAWRG